MIDVLFFILGVLFALVFTKKPIQIQIHHKNEDIVQPIPESLMPKMSEVMHNKDAEEDKAYEDMRSIVDEVNEIFGGSDNE
jgi:hypothetical protein